MNRVIYDSKDPQIGQTEFPSLISGIIADLRNTIDQLNSNSENAKKLILELARRLDEGQLCKQNQICRQIKYILKDKINKGHVTEKWIEDCLPDEYKRKYTKSEVNSLSKKAKKSQEMLVDNSGNAHAVMVSPNSSDTKNATLLQKEQLENSRYHGGECPRCSQLEALRKASQISTAEHLSKSEIMITIPNDKYEEIKSVMQKSSDVFYIIGNSTSGSFVRAELDMNDLI